MKRWIVGIDIGGTKIAVSLGTVNGKILDRFVFSAEQGKKVRQSIEKIKSSFLSLLSTHRIKTRDVLGVGVGVPGAIDPKTQVIQKSPNLPSWEGISLRKILNQKLNLPVSVENDANAAALGEYYFGSGKGINNFIYITVSTGIGSGIVANGQLLRGEKGTAGEVGHMTLVRGGNKCPCGKKGCLEAYSSGTAIANYVKRSLKNRPQSNFLSRVNINEITGQLVAEAAKRNDALAIRARISAADYLGIALANLINLLNPRRIILGGGVMEQTHHFWAPMMSAMKREAWPVALRSCEILRSKLGKYVGDLGAMALVLENRNTK